MVQPPDNLRNLVLVFGDQLDPDAPAFAGFDRNRDVVWMAEAHGEAAHVWSNKNRIAFFFAAMRHFREDLKERKAVLQTVLQRLG